MEIKKGDSYIKVGGLGLFFIATMICNTVQSIVSVKKGKEQVPVCEINIDESDSKKKTKKRA